MFRISSWKFYYKLCNNLLTSYFNYMKPSLPVNCCLKRQMRKFYANANMLIRTFSKCSVNVKCYLFKTYCSTMYCSDLWFNSMIDWLIEAYSPGFCTKKAKVRTWTMTLRSKFWYNFNHWIWIEGILNKIYRAQHKDKYWVSSINNSTMKCSI